VTTRYVDVDAEVGGNGTTADLTGANCAYKSLNIAEAAIGATLSEPHEIICGSAHANHTADTTAVTFSGTTTSAANYIDVYVSSGARHAGVWSASKYRLIVSAGYAGVVVLAESYVRLRYLQITNTSSNANYGVDAGNGGSSVGMLCDSCLTTVPDGNVGQGIYLYTTGSATLRNSIVYGCYSHGVNTKYSTSVIENCTSCGNGGSGFLQGSSGSLAIKNCYAGGNTGADFSGTMTDTTCASEDGTKGSTVAYSTSAGAYFTNITGGSEDFHIGASSELIGAGTDLSGSFTLDIDGETRPTGAGTWDIGADEYVAGGGVSVLPSTGVVTATGKTPSILQNFRIAVGLAALSLVGYAPTVAINQIVTPAVGALTVAGSAPTVALTDHKVIQPSVGQLNIVGFTSTVDVTDHKSAQPGLATLSLSGLAPTIQVSDHKTIPVSLGVLDLTGYAPSIGIGVNITPDVGSLTVAGFAPVVSTTDHKTVSPAVGSLTLAGFVPVVSATGHKTITPGVGLLTVAGFVPAVSASEAKGITRLFTMLHGGTRNLKAIDASTRAYNPIAANVRELDILL